MENSRTVNSLYNIASSIGIKVLTLLMSFVSRTVFIYTLGAVYLGLNGLFSNILSFLALSELGIGSAIAFLLYKPLAINDKEQIKAIMGFYKKCYFVVGLLILILGCCIMPFLTYLVNLEKPIPENLYIVFFLYVSNSAASYFFVAYKQSLLEANQKKYKLTKIEIYFTIVNCIVDIVILLLFKSFILYLVTKLLVVLLKNYVVAKKIDTIYPYLKEPPLYSLSTNDIKKVFKDVYSVSIFRLGSVLFNYTTNIVTSAIIGTIVVGYYSNYTLIIIQVEVLCYMLANAVASGIGNLVATESYDRQFEVYQKLNLLSYFYYGITSLCLFQVFNSFMRLWLGDKDCSYILSQFVVFLICANFYLNCSQQILERFKIAKGLFSIGRDLQVMAGTINVLLSIVLAKEIGLEGVLVSPIITKLFISIIPYVIRVGKYAFGKNPYYMLKEYFYQIVVVLLIGLINYYMCYWIHEKGLFYFIIEIVISMIISLSGIILAYHRTKAFKALYFQYIVKREYRIK